MLDAKKFLTFLINDLYKAAFFKRENTNGHLGIGGKILRPVRLALSIFRDSNYCHLFAKLTDAFYQIFLEGQWWH